MVLMGGISRNIPYGGSIVSPTSLGLMIADYMSVWWEGWSLAASKYKFHDLIYPVQIQGKGHPALLILLVINARGPHYQIFSLWKEGDADEKYAEDEYLQFAKSLAKHNLSLTLAIRDVSDQDSSSSLLLTESYLDISLIDAKQKSVHYQTFTASSSLSFGLAPSKPIRSPFGRSLPIRTGAYVD